MRIVGEDKDEKWQGLTIELTGEDAFTLYKFLFRTVLGHLPYDEFTALNKLASLIRQVNEGPVERLDTHNLERYVVMPKEDV